MVKKMLVSMTAMGVTAAAVVFMLIALTSGETSGSPDEKSALARTFSDDTYFYYLTEQEIDKIIEEGITSFFSLEKYILPAASDSEDIAFAYIEPPALTVARKTSETYQLYGRKVKREEVTKELMDGYLPFSIRFRENKGFLYEAAIEQDGEIIYAEKEEVLGGGAMKRAYFNVPALDFETEAKLVLIDTVTDEKAMFTLVFSEYD
ncbi:hypothetical protein MM300_03930 [Evansella sp. LMS18]|uniref:hypothetical protein n=1 Tax=Evansella sp. LMS18 TaxID=2924033 RepID=UPI0020D0A53B|nr:hypothetical protein [Evansella sp. LMS18]UTR11490.1 hypothetical protein MM300_03930 [Evansella sp. LMS18]